MDPLEKAASDLQKLARYFGDRQNSDSTLTAKECTFLVTACLNGGNHLEMVVRERLNRPTTTGKDDDRSP